jgi:hypothetical protein
MISARKASVLSGDPVITGNLESTTQAAVISPSAVGVLEGVRIEVDDRTLTTGRAIMSGRIRDS